VDNEKKEKKKTSQVSFFFSFYSKTFSYLSLFMEEEGYIVLFYFLLSFNGQEIAVQAQGCIINQLLSAESQHANRLYNTQSRYIFPVVCN